MLQILGSTVLASLLITIAPAQLKTWVVDVNSGPGSTHRSVLGAVDAARDGDKVVIRAGTAYAWPPAIDKALVFQGEGAVTVNVVTQVPSLRIHGIAAGKTITFRDLKIRTAILTAPTGVCFVDRVAGTVVFDNVVLLSTVGAPSLNIMDSPHVVLRNCSVDGYAVCVRSRLMIEGGTIRGMQNLLAATLDPGILLDDGELSITDARVTGAAAYLAGAGGHAIVAIQGRVMLRGAGTVLRGGARTNGSALFGWNVARLFLDPAVSLIPDGAGQPIIGFGQRVTKRLPALRSTNTPVTGQKFDYTLTGKPNDRYVLFFSLPWTGFTLPGQEAYLFTPAILVQLHGGNLDRNGLARFSLQLSSDPFWSHWTFNIQGATASASEWNMTNEIILSQR